MGLTNQPPDLLPGTLDMLILRTLLRGDLHGYGIAERLRQVSEDVLQVGESSLYPALQRLLLNGWVTAEWGTSENNRRARYYTLTPAGRKRLGTERREFDRLIGAIQRGGSAAPEECVKKPSGSGLRAPGFRKRARAPRSKWDGHAQSHLVLDQSTSSRV